jgi:hypothetical protein
MILFLINDSASVVKKSLVFFITFFLTFFLTLTWLFKHKSLPFKISPLNYFSLFLDYKFPRRAYLSNILHYLSKLTAFLHNDDSHCPHLLRTQIKCFHRNLRITTMTLFSLKKTDSHIWHRLESSTGSLVSFELYITFVITTNYIFSRKVKILDHFKSLSPTTLWHLACVDTSHIALRVYSYKSGYY